MGGWMGGRESRVKDCLQQSKSSFYATFEKQEVFLTDTA
jgi:hypothetical protein